MYVPDPNPKRTGPSTRKTTPLTPTRHNNQVSCCESHRYDVVCPTIPYIQNTVQSHSVGLVRDVNQNKRWRRWGPAMTFLCLAGPRGEARRGSYGQRPWVHKTYDIYYLPTLGRVLVLWRRSVATWLVIEKKGKGVMIVSAGC